MNALISGPPSSRVPVRAVTMYVPAWPAFVMNRLAPSRTQRAAVWSVLVARGRARAARVAAGAGFGQPVRADDLAARHRDEEPLLLLRRPARWSGPQPRLVWAATMSPSDPQTRPISSTATA